ncbi:977_t:CDS:2, partial [Racocetra persica]
MTETSEERRKRLNRERQQRYRKKLQQTSGTNSTEIACNTPTREEEFRATKEAARQRNEVEVSHQQISRKEKERERLLSCNSTFEEVASRNESPALNPSVLA